MRTLEAETLEEEKEGKKTSKTFFRVDVSTLKYETPVENMIK